jgi:hypothetical protein
MTKTFLALAAAWILVAPAAAAPRERPVPASAEVSIPFANFRGLRDFQAESKDVVYLQDRSRRWYRAELIGPCLELPWALRIGIDTRGSSSFDRFGSLLVRGERCQLRSLTRSDGPPKKRRKRS